MSVCKSCVKHKRIECTTGNGEDKINPSVDNQSKECSKCLGLNDIERPGDKVHCGIKQPIVFLMISDNCFVNLSFEFEVLSAITKVKGL